MIVVASTARLDALLANIKLANNGYLILDYMRADDQAFACESAKTGSVVITNGTVHLPATKPEFFKTPIHVAKAIRLKHEGPDYEGAILMQQANDGFFD